MKRVTKEVLAARFAQDDLDKLTPELIAFQNWTNWLWKLSGSTSQISDSNVQLNSTGRVPTTISCLRRVSRHSLLTLLRLDSRTPSQAHRRSQREATPRPYKLGASPRRCKATLYRIRIRFQQGFSPPQVPLPMQPDASTSFGGTPPNRRVCHDHLSELASQFQEAETLEFESWPSFSSFRTWRMNFRSKLARGSNRGTQTNHLDECNGARPAIERLGYFKLHNGHLKWKLRVVGLQGSQRFDDTITRRLPKT